MKFENANLCSGCVRCGGSYAPECTRCEKDVVKVEYIDLTTEYSEQKRKVYNRRKGKVMSARKAERALSVVTAKYMSLPEEAHDLKRRAYQSMRNCEKKVSQTYAITFKCPELPNSVKGRPVDFLKTLVRSTKASKEITEMAKEALEWVKIAERLHGYDRAIYQEDGRILIRLVFQSKRYLKEFANIWKTATATA